MASVGRQLVRGLGAAMSGYGTGMLQQEALAQRERESAALAAREAALIDLRHRRNEEGADANVGRTLRIAEGGAAIDVAKHGRIRQLDEPFEERRETRAERRQVSAEAREQDTWRERLQMTTDAEIEENVRKQRLGLLSDDDRSTTVVSRGVDANGHEVVVFADGNQLNTGLRPTTIANTEARGEQGGGGMIPRRGGSAPASAAPAPAPAPQGGPVRIRSAAEYDRLAPGTEYIDPNGQRRRKPR